MIWRGIIFHKRPAFFWLLERSVLNWVESEFLIQTMDRAWRIGHKRLGKTHNRKWEVFPGQAHKCFPFMSRALKVAQAVSGHLIGYKLIWQPVNIALLNCIQKATFRDTAGSKKSGLKSQNFGFIDAIIVIIFPSIAPFFDMTSPAPQPLLPHSIFL